MITILDALRDPMLFGPFFSTRDTWSAWEAFLAAVFGLAMTNEQLGCFRVHAARTTQPHVAAREAWVAVGRRGGKSRIAALVAVYLACFRDYRSVLAPGERGTLPIIAADRRQARTVLRYVNGLLDGCPMLGRGVVSRTAESVELSNGITIEVHTASFRAVRGYTVVAAILDEVAFWRTDEAANPDHEIVAALRPAMATVPGSLLLAISSPYARRGVLWDAYHRHYGRDGDPILVWQADTAAMNPAVDPAVIAEAYAADEATAAAEYGAQFRRDIESFVQREAVEACVVAGRRELSPAAGVAYTGFVDPSGGSADSMTLAIAHPDGERVVVDCVLEARAPFSPERVVAEFADSLRHFGVPTVTGDRYAGEWPREAFRTHGIGYALAERPKSDLYRDVLPLLNSARVELPDHPRLIAEILGLERRTSRAGRDLIDHAPGGHDDLANAVAGAILGAAVPASPFLRRTEHLATVMRGDRVHPFSPAEPATVDEIAIECAAFDGDTDAPRAVHVVISSAGDAAGLAIGYAKRPRQPLARFLNESEIVTYGDLRTPAVRRDMAPSIVVEGVLRVVASPGDEVTADELVSFVVRLHDEARVPIRWVTMDRPPSVAALRRLHEHGIQTGERSVRGRTRLVRGDEERDLPATDPPVRLSSARCTADGDDRRGGAAESSLGRSAGAWARGHRRARRDGPLAGSSSRELADPPSAGVAATGHCTDVVDPRTAATTCYAHTRGPFAVDGRDWGQGGFRG